MNQISIIGRLGKDPELKYFDNGKCKATFSMAVDRGRKDKEGNRITDWFNCEAWGKQAELIGEHVKNGNSLGIGGAMINDRYEKDGERKDFWKVNVMDITFIGGKQQEGQSGENMDQIPF